MDDQYPVIALAIGLGLLAGTWACWTGRWRRWVESSGIFGRNAVIAGGPAVGILALAFGVSWLLPAAYEVPVQGVGFLVMLGGVVLHLWEPDWYGPKWFRRVHRAFRTGASASLAHMAEDPRRPDESSVQATERHEESGRPLPRTAKVRLVDAPYQALSPGNGGESSILAFYPHAVVWQGHQPEYGRLINQILPTESLRAVRHLEPGMRLDGSVRYSGWRSRRVPRVRLDTDEGSWLFQSRHAERIVREIEWRYLDDSRDMYGVPLERESPGRGE